MDWAVAQVSSVEMIRDGGSLAAVWEDVAGQKHWLFFPVRIAEVDPDHDRIAGWSDPECHNRSAGTREQIGWAKARLLIDTLRAHLDDEADRQKLNAMDDIAAQGGQITASSQAAFYSVGTPRRVVRPGGIAPSDA